MADRFERLEEDVDLREPPPLRPEETGPDMGSFRFLFVAARQLLASNIDSTPKDLLRETLVERIYIVIDDQVTLRASTSTQLRNFLDNLDRIDFAIPDYRRESFERGYRILLAHEQNSVLRDPPGHLIIPSFEIARPALPAMPVFGEGIFGPEPLLQEVQAPTFFEERDALPGGFNPWRDHPAEQNRPGPRTQATLDDIGPGPDWDYSALVPYE